MPNFREKQKVGGVKKKVEKKEKKKSVSWPMLPQGAWVKINNNKNHLFKIPSINLFQEGA